MVVDELDRDDRVRPSGTVPPVAMPAAAPKAKDRAAGCPQRPGRRPKALRECRLPGPRTRPSPSSERAEDRPASAAPRGARVRWPHRAPPSPWGAAARGTGSARAPPRRSAVATASTPGRAFRRRRGRRLLRRRRSGGCRPRIARVVRQRVLPARERPPRRPGRRLRKRSGRFAQRCRLHEETPDLGWNVLPATAMLCTLAWESAA